MKEGTRSLLFGYHNPVIHGLAVLIAWRREYHSWPKWWELICILLHDIGIWGRDYLSDDEAKKGHEMAGARLALAITRNERAYVLCYTHVTSNIRKGRLWLPDKKSWLMLPNWVWWICWWVERGRKMGLQTPPVWKRIVEDNLAKKEYRGSHQLYIDHKGG